MGKEKQDNSAVCNQSCWDKSEAQSADQQIEILIRVPDHSLSATLVENVGHFKCFAGLCWALHI